MIKFDPSLLPSLTQGIIPPDVVVGTRRFYELNPGDKFKALILDIKPGQVTIRLDGGGTFTARSLVLPEARIGEESLFVVKENDMQGHISLEMGKLTPEERQDNVAREALRNAGVQVNEETLQLGRTLIKNNMPLDVNTLHKATFYQYALPEGKTTPLDGVVFLLKENFPTEQPLVAAFNAVLEEPQLLQKNVSRVMDWIARAEPEQTQILLRALLREKEAPPENMAEIENLLQKKLFLPIHVAKNGKPPLLNDYYQELSSTMEKLVEAAKTNNITGTLPEAADKARETVRFMAQLSNQQTSGQREHFSHREYYQIPFVNQPNEQKYQADLVVFKDKKTSGADGNKSYSALIALDTAGLAHTEAYIQKTVGPSAGGTSANGQVSITFRCDTAKALKTISAASGLLTQALRKKNINIAGLTFNEITEPFTILSAEPNAESRPEKPEGNKRFTFDMRI